jgi:hypothetical protein
MVQAQDSNRQFYTNAAPQSTLAAPVTPELFSTGKIKWPTVFITKLNNTLALNREMQSQRDSRQ